METKLNQGEFEELEERTIEWNSTFRERVLAAVRVESQPFPATEPSALSERLREMAGRYLSAIGHYPDYKLLNEAATALETLTAQLATLEDNRDAWTLLATDAQRRAEAAEARAAALAQALREMRDGCAAAMRVCERHGLADEFVSEAREAGVTDGFGVRANKALALTSQPTPGSSAFVSDGPT